MMSSGASPTGWVPAARSDRDMYLLARFVQMVGLAITFLDVVLFFFRNMTMMFLLKIFILGVCTFYIGYFLQTLSGRSSGRGDGSAGS